MCKNERIVLADIGQNGKLLENCDQIRIMSNYGWGNPPQKTTFQALNHDSRIRRMA